jgi:Lrp/AsnC family leucine-responsive transcriptional regulator
VAAKQAGISQLMGRPGLGAVGEVCEVCEVWEGGEGGRAAVSMHSMVGKPTGSFHACFKLMWNISLDLPGSNAQSPCMTAATAFDSYDTRILAELQADARQTLAELGRRVHLSQPAVTERVRKLEAAGVITGYRATVNLAALGYGIRAVVRVGRVDFGRMSQLVDALPEVVTAWNVTGENSWILEIAVTDVAHLDAVVTQLCLMAETSTSIILKTVREHRPMGPARKETP